MGTPGEMGRRNLTEPALLSRSALEGTAKVDQELAARGWLTEAHEFCVHLPDAQFRIDHSMTNHRIHCILGDRDHLIDICFVRDQRRRK